MSKSNKTKRKKTLIICLAAAVIVCAAILIVTALNRPEIKSEYTGSYSADVYIDGKLDKEASKAYLLVLNEEGDGSIVLNNEAINGKWTATEDGIKIKGKRLKSKNGMFIYEDKETKTKVYFGSTSSDTKDAKK